MVNGGLNHSDLRDFDFTLTDWIKFKGGLRLISPISIEIVEIELDFDSI